jgi:hypothetical protein
MAVILRLCRGYAEKDAAMAFWPTQLGEALITGYRCVQGSTAFYSH